MDTETAIKLRARGENLDEINKLNLSSLGLKTLDGRAFEKLKCLECLDISSNNLSSLTTLPLPRLKKLSCDLNMFTNVLFLKNVPSLEELFLSGNPLSLADRYIAVALLPKLIKLDNKECSKLREVDQVTADRLWPQILKAWETHFSDCLTADLTASHLDNIERQFICHVKRIRTFGLEVPNRFKQFKAEELAKEHFKRTVDSLRNSKISSPRQSSQKHSEQSRNSTPKKCVSWNTTSQTPSKSPKKRVEEQNFRPNLGKDFNSNDNNQISTSPKKRLQKFVDESIQNWIFSPRKLDNPHSTNNETSASPRKHFEPDNTNSQTSTRSPRKHLEPDDTNSQTSTRSPRKHFDTDNTNNQTSCRSPRKHCQNLGEGAPNLRSSPRGHLVVTEKVNQQTPQKISTKNSVTVKDALDELLINSFLRVSPRKRYVTDRDKVFASSESRTSPRKQNKINHSLQNSSENESILNEEGTGSTTKGAAHTGNQNGCGTKRSSDEFNQKSSESGLKKLKFGHSTPQNYSVSHHRKNLFGSSKSRKEPLQDDVRYCPKVFLRCHSRDNDPTDCDTQVWCAAFEPDVSNPGKTTSTVASCGGTNVCLIDCITGRIMKRYKHNDPDEDFFCLAWTVMPLEKSNSTVLAVAGLKREVVLLHPSQLVSYHTFKAHSKDINCMAFHPKMTTWLLTGSSDKTISIWNVGIPSCPDYKTDCKKLFVFEAGFEILQLVISPSYDLVIGACQGALLAWHLNESSIITTANKKKPQFQFELEEFQNNETTTVDGLHFLSDKQVAVKVTGSGKIYICDLEDSLKLSQSTTKGQTSIVPTVVISVLEWSTCKTMYLYLRASADGSILACGDDEGNVWVYNVKELVKQACRDSEKLLKPSWMLRWPDLHSEDDKMELPNDEKISINATSLSWNGKYLVACTNKNLLCIWEETDVD